MRATEALGVDGIPVSVLKKGIEVLAGPISHLVTDLWRPEQFPRLSIVERITHL
ncbi:Hypothetical protein FKW44_005427 [Caligus rogercresseyi]|uniref:Uncharacterized protein n=1 Tax=Caligus rogercresseyi TaxID=217165 RepID=A0A7T8KBX9_CALRO|nr:Hypothetical protein FKW44_005427 [Caligus rogercresseyi]